MAGTHLLLLLLLQLLPLLCQSLAVENWASENFLTLGYDAYKGITAPHLRNKLAILGLCLY